MQRKRLFVCIELPEKTSARLAGLDPQMPGVRWLAAEQMHLTLSFLGDVSPPTQAALEESLSEIQSRPFFLPLTGFGAFPGKGRPNVIWIGVGRGHPHLFQLHKRVQEAALKAGLEPDLRAFHPHVTLARCRDVSAESIRPFLKTHAALDAGLIHVETFCLNSSALAAAGSIYTRELVIQSR